MLFPDPTEHLLGMTADIVTAYVGRNTVAITEIGSLITTVHGALVSLVAPITAAASVPVHEPAVTVKKSLADPACILSMIDGKPYTMLKRHLAQHGLTPDEYRARYDLPADYPMTAKAYSERRRELALSIGLGRKKA